MLFGEDINATTEDLPAVLSFQHKLIQEYLAAVYIVENLKLDTAEPFLTNTFPSLKVIETHREVVQFACGILADTDASPIANHVAKILAQHMQNELNNGKRLPQNELSAVLPILRSCHKEGGLSALNPYMSEYTACGHPLAEVLSHTELAYITDIDENDTLELNPSPAQIIVRLVKVDGEKYDRLWLALHSVKANITALHLYRVETPNVAKLHRFPQVKYLYIWDCGCSEAAMEDLADSIKCWVPKPELTFCHLRNLPIPRSVLEALCACPHLMHLDLSYCNLSGKLSILMGAPPPLLRELILYDCSLQNADTEHITEAIRQGQLSHMERLNIRENPVGEVAVDRLLETLISTRPPNKLTLMLWRTGVDEDGEPTDLSKQFVTEWKVKPTGTNINVDW